MVRRKCSYSLSLPVNTPVTVELNKGIYYSIELICGLTQWDNMVGFNSAIISEGKFSALNPANWEFEVGVLQGADSGPQTVKWRSDAPRGVAMETPYLTFVSTLGETSFGVLIEYEPTQRV